MKYQIHFIKGELSGQIFPIGKDSVSIGRSHKNDIILNDEDISRRHLIISSTANGLKLDNLSAGKTIIDKTPLALGGSTRILSGVQISIGEKNIFVIESLETESSDEATVSTVCPEGEEFPYDENENTAVSSAEDFSLRNDEINQAGTDEANLAGNETIGMQTRMATPEEIQYIKEREKKQITFRWISYAAIFFFLLCGIGFYLYFFLFQAPEKTIEWPKDEKQNPRVGVYWIKKLPKPAFFALMYPMLPKGDVKIQETADKIELKSKIGRNSDIDIYISVELHQNTLLLHETREESFKRWCSVKNQGKNSWNFEVQSPVAFFSRDSGIPYIKVSYSRNRDNTLFYGFAYYLRYADWEIIATAEIPAKEKWRSYALFTNDFIAFDDGFLFTHWEGMPSINEMQISQLIDEAQLLLSRNSPSLWQRVEFLLCSAFIQGIQTKNRKFEGRAQRLLIKLRLNQIEWYNMQKIAYWRLHNLNDISNRKKIETSCRAVFSSPEDLRYHKVRKNDWK